MPNKYLLIGLIAVLVSSCEGDASKSRFDFINAARIVSDFNADSAYNYIQMQVDLGPRNPGSEGHELAKHFLADILKQYAGRANVYSQNFQQMGYTDTLYLTNIIASFNPESSVRIMLCAHWDTRPRADQEPDPADAIMPILGADDGGSGVGVLIELARIFSNHPPPIGVDIVLFDGEDYGKSNDINKYFLGARYWSKNPPVSGYMPRFAILLDMVGGNNAQFLKEGYSRTYASKLVDQVWEIADLKNYGQYFINQNGGAVADDHMILNQVYGLPTINIIHYYSDGRDVRFPLWWHTHSDTMDIISKETLQAVGDVLLEIIYNRVL